MSLFIHAARPVLARGTINNARFAHVENTVYNNMPFQYRNNKAFAAKLVSYCGLGFAIPFIAVYYQMHKGDGDAA